MSNPSEPDVIANRVFELRDAEGTETEVELLLGRPVPDPREGGDWACPYVVRGFGEDRPGTAFGADPIQALQLALQKANAELGFYARGQKSTLTWFDDEDLGLI